MHTVFALLDDASAEGHAQARSRLYTGHAGTWRVVRLTGQTTRESRRRRVAMDVAPGMRELRPALFEIMCVKSLNEFAPRRKGAAS